MSEYFIRMKDFDYFIKRLINGKACAEGPKGFKYYDALYRAVCLGEVLDIDADPGPYYPFVLIAHYFWRRGDVCRACVFLEKVSDKRPFRYDDDDEKTAIELLKAAIREGAEGVWSIETEDSHWSWASLFKDLLVAELDPSARVVALRRIKSGLREVFEAADVPDYIAEGYNIIRPSMTPYDYIYYAAAELERRELPRRGIKDLLRGVFRRVTSAN